MVTSGSLVVQEIKSFYKILKFITSFTKDHHSFLFWDTHFQITTSKLTYLQYIEF
jgi:hypothetical protein